MIKTLQSGLTAGFISLFCGFSCQAAEIPNNSHVQYTAPPTAPYVKNITFFCPSQRPENITNITAQYTDGNVLLAFFTDFASPAFKFPQVSLLYDGQNFNAENITYSTKTTRNPYNHNIELTYSLSFWVPVSTFKQFANANNRSVKFGTCPVFTPLTVPQINYLRQFAQSAPVQ